jgi:hypothetical protein
MALIISNISSSEIPGPNIADGCSEEVEDMRELLFMELDLSSDLYL